jgi:hypothetical protein
MDVFWLYWLGGFFMTMISLIIYSVMIMWFEQNKKK